jgi:hypothetical protein
MIIVRLMGGLGNQLFQYATGRSLALIHNTKLELDISNVAGSNNPVLKYGLNNFNIEENFASLNEIGHYTGNHPAFLYRYYYRLNKRIFHPSLYVEKDFSFQPEVLSLPDNTFLSGFWQSEKYFKSTKAILLEDLKFKDNPDEANWKILDKILQVNSVSVHIRRGDYVSDPDNNSFHGALPIRYYEKCVDYLAERLADPHFFVFSDDPSWAMANFKTNFPTSYVTQNGSARDHDDLRLMSNCRHNIIANSSFSWWGAWINKYPSKVVLAPAQWFRDASINTVDLIPLEWIKIPLTGI